MEQIVFNCNIKDPTSPLPHVWEHTVGSGRASLALRADWQKGLQRCHQELGFQHVRFHGILSDDMGTLVCQNNKYIFSFFNTDQICDFLLSIGMKPFVELSFMPTILASGTETVFHYKGNVTPPKDLNAWRDLIIRLLEHWKLRYGAHEVRQWFFEVWNEPNLKDFWTGNQDQYFDFYMTTADAIKKVDPLFKVGGPATAQNAWIKEFVDYAIDKNTPLDFVSTHQYPTDALGKPGDDTMTQLALSHRDILREQAIVAKEQARGKPLYYTEWSTSSNPFDELHDTTYAAAGIVKSVLSMKDIVSGYSYWTFSDIFEENYFSSDPFHGGFGLLNIYGIPKPSYRAFELLHRLGHEALHVQGSHGTVEVWVTRADKSLKVLINNWALPKHGIQTELVRVRIQGIERIRTSYIEIIDETHANSFEEWVRHGRPQSLSLYEVEALEAASALKKEPFAAISNSEGLWLDVAVSPQSVVCVTVEI
ncbi:MAG: GH39 family glycosyl hydrolase [Pseudobdellovibrionaceae bacterium]